MGSESRQRDRIITVRVDDLEYKFIDQLAAAAKCSRAEIVRAIVFEREPVPQPPRCSERHLHCTNGHREMVAEYRDQRYREELAVEAMTGNHPGDIADWKARGGRLTTFTTWLKAHRRTA
jgi:hypothetical protein